MHVWLMLIGGSILSGFLSAKLLKKNWGIYVAGAVPWFALLSALIYTEYFTTYEGGGASMWLVAQLFGGTIGAVVGTVSYKLTAFLLKRSVNTL